jgi:DNA-binding NarL/FixJ family response regulator
MPTRILIADDNPVVRRTLRHLFEAADSWEIIEAGDGDEAIAKSVETRPDVIILDLAMPVKDGLSAAREISKALPETPILMCTMHASPQLDIEAQKSGVRQIIPKSESSVLIPVVQQLVAKNPSTDSTGPLDSTPPLPSPEASPAVALNPSTDAASTAEVSSNPADIGPKRAAS